jgi:hypothetical protein
MYQYTSLGRPLEPSLPAGKAVLYLLSAAAVLGMVMGWVRQGNFTGVLYTAALFPLVIYGTWALARELDPDDTPVAFMSMVLGLLAALLIESPGILVVYVTLGLVRMVNRSSGLAAKRSDSIAMMVLAIVVIYSTQSPLFGAVAALAFFLDGSLRLPERSQWVYGLICLGGMVVYMVDHDIGFPIMHWPRTLFEWRARRYDGRFPGGPAGAEPAGRGGHTGVRYCGPLHRHGVPQGIQSAGRLIFFHMEFVYETSDYSDYRPCP